MLYTTLVFILKIANMMKFFIIYFIWLTNSSKRTLEVKLFLIYQVTK